MGWRWVYRRSRKSRAGQSFLKSVLCSDLAFSIETCIRSFNLLISLNDGPSLVHSSCLLLLLYADLLSLKGPNVTDCGCFKVKLLSSVQSRLHTHNMGPMISTPQQNSCNKQQNAVIATLFQLFILMKLNLGQTRYLMITFCKV